MIVLNFEVAGIIRRARRFRYETVKAVSSSLASVSDADMSRSLTFLNALRSYIAHVISAPALDLPESSPYEINLGEPEKLDMPENESFVDLMVMYDLLEKEVGNSQSARQATGIISHDHLRMVNLINKMEDFLNNYVKEILPLDLPESSPLRDVTGGGRTGV